MRRYGRQSGMTLNELLVVMAAIVVLTLMAVPAARRIGNSFETGYAVRNVIAAALSNARAIAVKEQKYAGVRFQQDLNGDQYMIFIVHDFDATGLANGFRAVQGRKPVKLPPNVGLMDLRIRTNRSQASVGEDSSAVVLSGGVIDDNATNLNLDEAFELRDTTTFVIVFSPAGRLVIHQARVRRRTNLDDVFNTMDQLDNAVGMLYQDDYATLGLGQAPSRNRFMIYDKRRLAAVPAARRWSDYLKQEEWVYVNPHTGELVNN